jgi:hypothetical protein
VIPRFVAIAGCLWTLWVPGVAAAEIDGPCSAAFNGVDVDRIDSLSSPLELDATDTLVFSGIDPTGTLEASVSLVLGPISIDSSTTTYGPVEQEYAAALDLDDTSPYGVGLYRVRGTTDDCTVTAWLRVTGRHPLATLTGLTAAGLAVGGLTGQITAILTRRRRSPQGAALGGLATGLGGALLGQQFGRMQISYVSILLSMAIAAGLGFLIAWMMRRPDVRGSWGDEDDVRRQIHPRHSEETADAPRPAEEATTGADRPVSVDAGPYWCYVMAPVDAFDLNDHTRIIATLQPGTWYLAKREVSGWVHVVAGEGAEGWVAQGSVHRQG